LNEIVCIVSMEKPDRNQPMARGDTMMGCVIADRFYHTARWGLAGLFIFSGLTKLVDPVRFAQLIEAYGLLPDMLVLPAAVMLSVGEVVAGACLIFNVPGSLTVIALLLALFMAVLGYGIWLGLDVDCGCFGPDDPEAQAFHGLRPALYRDVAILSVVVCLYVWRYRRTQRPLRLLNIL
jgi:uncharacterized membrane protein YphA (DoxX/SURF4 family)